jgi:cell division protein FtsW
VARKLTFDRPLFVVGIGLALFGLVMIFSASAPLAMERHQTPYHFLMRQMLAFAIGIAGMAMAMNVDYRSLLKRPVVGLAIGGAALLLAGVLVVDRTHQVHRSFKVGPIQVQPSELAKLAIVLFLAAQMAKHENKVNDIARSILPTAVVVLPLAGLVYLEPDLGTAALYVILTGILLFLAGLRWRYVLTVAGAGAFALAALIIAAPYRLRRITAFLNPDDDPLGAGFQVRQSIIAVASGGLQGASLGESRQKLFFLPEPHTDFIFSVVCEELGLIGAVCVLAAFGVFFWRGLKAAQGAPDRGGFYLAMGITLLLTLQALINMGVCLGVLPTKGVPLPFLSYGGSSLVVNLFALGMLLNVSQHSAT